MAKFKFCTWGSEPPYILARMLTTKQRCSRRRSARSSRCVVISFQGLKTPPNFAYNIPCSFYLLNSFVVCSFDAQRKPRLSLFAFDPLFIEIFPLPSEQPHSQDLYNGDLYWEGTGRKFVSEPPPGVGGTPRKIGCGCAARLSEPSPYL